MTYANVRPIPLRAWEVKAVLAGTLTQLWRAMKRQPDGPGVLMNTPAGDLWYVWPHEQEPGVWVDHFCAFSWGKVGSRIWGRETFFVYASGNIAYRTDYGPKSFEGGAKGWCSSATMPRSHSRILLEIEAVSALAVQGVTLADIEAMGIPGNPMQQMSYRNDGYQRIEDFKFQWDQDNPRHPWSSNPMAWRLTVRRVES